MRSASSLAIILLAVGLTLVIWGVTAADSLSSEASQLFQGAHSNTSIALMAIGVLVSAFGLVRWSARAA